jgi:hypothetical protein
MSSNKQGGIPVNNPIVVGIIIAVFSFGLSAMAIFLRSLNSQVGALRGDVRELNTKVAPFWARVQQQMSTDLHHPHPRYAEMDGLLEELEALVITPEKRLRLKQLLVERSNDFHEDITDDQRSTAILMVRVMDKTLIEAERSRDLNK